MEFLSGLGLSTIVWSLIAIFEIVVRITPSDKDNSILNKIIWVIEKLIPNKDKKKQGMFNLFKRKK